MSRNVERLTLGVFIWNKGDSPATITGVSLVGERGLSLFDAIVLPMPSQRLAFGLYSDYPPEVEEQQQDDWAAREPAVGATLEVGEERQLLVAMEVQESDMIEAFPAARGFRIDYQGGDGAAGSLVTNTPVGAGESCDLEVLWEWRTAEPIS